MTGASGAGRLLREGFVASADVVASVSQRQGVDGGRIVDVRLAGGLMFEVLPERGLDLGALWWSGYPVSYRSPQPPGRSQVSTREDGWLTAWGGGMLTTCGVDNIGPARDGYGLHGSHHAIPAEDLQIRRVTRGDHLGVVVSGTVRNVEVFGRRVTLRREIEAWTDTPSVEIRDRITNDGVATVAVPVLYHVNFGSPFISPTSRIEVGPATTIAREVRAEVPDPHELPYPTTEMMEAVFEHRAGESPARERSAAVHSPALGAVARLTWTTASLPRLFQWVWPTRGGWALGLEPANSPLFGPDRDAPHAGAPLLEPGADIITRVTLSIDRTSDALGGARPPSV